MTLKQQTSVHVNGSVNGIFSFLFWMRSINSTTIKADMLAVVSNVIGNL
jgi:hypothetical protein